MIRSEGKHIKIVNESIEGVIYYTDIVLKHYWLFFKGIDGKSYQLVIKNNKTLRKQLRKNETIIIGGRLEYRVIVR